MKIGRLENIYIILNDYFILLLGVYFLLGVLPQALLLFLSIVWHEGCHAVVARCFGWQVKSVELFPFGGVARLQRPSGSLHLRSEVIIALAGPLASFSLSAIAFLTGHAIWSYSPWFDFFCQSNLILGCFNLWPGLPLDGGRIYRGLRASKVGLAQATLEGVNGGKLLAFILGIGSIIGFYLQCTDLQGLALALFIYFAAQQEGNVVPYMFWQDFWRRRNKHNSPKSGKVFWLYSYSELTLGRIVKLFSPRAFNMVAVINSSGRFEGILTETEILEEILAGKPNTTLSNLLENR